MYFLYKNYLKYAKIEKSSVKTLRRSEIKITFWKKSAKKKVCSKKIIEKIFPNFVREQISTLPDLL